MKKFTYISLFFFCICLMNLVAAQNAELDNAASFLEEGKNDEALAVLSKKKDNFHNNARYFKLLGEAYHALENFDDAINAFEKCIELEGDHANHHYLLGNTLIDKLQVTESLFKKGSLAYSARTSLLRAIELQPSHIEARERLANYYLNAPLIAGGSNTKAHEQANEIIKYDQVKGRTLLATIYVNRKAYQEAEGEYKALLKMDSSNTNTMYNLGNFYIDRARYDEAFELASTMTEDFPDALLGYYFYGRLASISKKNIATGKKYMMKFIQESPEKSSPSKHWAYYRLALLKKELGEEYKGDASKALELYPDFSRAKDLLKE